jgi:integrase
MVKKRGAKRRPWNKGLEVGKKGAFTPAQVKRIRQVLMAHGASGLRDLALFQVAIDTMLHGSDLFNLTVKEVQLPNGKIRSVIKVARWGGMPPVRCAFSKTTASALGNGSPCLARSVQITFSQAGAPVLLVRWGFDT